MKKILILCLFIVAGSLFLLMKLNHLNNNYIDLRSSSDMNKNLILKDIKEKVSEEVRVDDFKQTIKLYYWNWIKSNGEIVENFGDRLSYELVSRIVGHDIQTIINETSNERKLIAIGSILNSANNDDVVWGSGFLTYTGKNNDLKNLDIRSVRGPRTRKILKEVFNKDAPEIYGDPALLFPYFFPEFKRSKQPKYDYVVVPHMSQGDSLSNHNDERVVKPTEDWRVVVTKITNAKLVISTSLHGIIIAESFGIPARLLNANGYFQKKPYLIFKYEDYYYGTKRFGFKYANSIEEALEMGGEPPMKCNLEKLYSVFPKEFFGNKLVYEKLPKIDFD